jgi:hypothetical protein
MPVVLTICVVPPGTRKTEISAPVRRFSRIWKLFLAASVELEARDTARGNLTCESCGMMRWIFRLIAVAVVGKFLNRYLATQRTPEPRRP